jgi:hypothetical protein
MGQIKRYGAYKGPPCEERNEIHCSRPAVDDPMPSPKLTSPLDIEINISLPFDFTAPTTIPRRRPIIPRHQPSLLMGQVRVHARHPRVDLVGQQAFATFIDMLGPVVHALLGGLEIRDVVVAHPADGVRRYIDL